MKRIKTPFVAAIFAILVAAMSSAATLTVEQRTRALRPISDGAVEISGITWAGGDLYYAVDDDDGRLYPLTIAINRADGTFAQSNIVVGAGVALADGDDMEGCAFDSSSGKVWVSQEVGALIREYDPATGEIARSAPVPAVQKQYRSNYGLESLTISRDGLAMWTSNEEALTVDGPLATDSAGSVVRLTRFTRASPEDDWTPAGQWAYVTQPIGTAKDSRTRSGVSGLCELPDGTLLVLERRCYKGSILPKFDIRLYRAEFDGATDVSSFASLDGASYAAAGKTMLWELDDPAGISNFEGVCLGPRLDDGSYALVLVADGGKSASPEVMTLRLSITDWK